MDYFSIRDIEKKYSFNLESGNFDLPWFFKLCIRWSNLSLPTVFNLQSKLPQEETIESVLPLLIEAKKEIETLPCAIEFLPNWSLFGHISHWINKFYRVQKSELKGYLVAKIEEATLKTPRVLQREDAVDRKITQCMEDHCKEIARQPQVQDCQTYRQIRAEMEKSTEELQRLLEHRKWVVEHEGPKGRPLVLPIGEKTYFTHRPASNKERLDFERTRLVHVDNDIERELMNTSQIATECQKFFLPAKYDNPIAYKELLEQRTKEALALIKL